MWWLRSPIRTSDSTAKIIEEKKFFGTPYWTAKTILFYPFQQSREFSPVTSKQKARLELKRLVGLLVSEVVNVLTANPRFTHGYVGKC